jgi:hypothetical protein
MIVKSRLLKESIQDFFNKLLYYFKCGIIKELFSFSFDDRRFIRFHYQALFHYFWNRYITRGANNLRNKEYLMIGYSDDDIGYRKFIIDLMKNPDNTILMRAFCEKPYKCPSSTGTKVCELLLHNKTCNSCNIGKSKKLYNTMGGKYFRLVVDYIPFLKDLLQIMRYNDLRGEETYIIASGCKKLAERFLPIFILFGLKGMPIFTYGRICRNMDERLKSHKGIKIGLTRIRPKAEQQLLKVLEGATKKKPIE